MNVVKFLKASIILLLTLVALPIGICSAAPAISGVSGTLSHGQIVTINGSSFGVKSPVAPLLWDSVDNSYPGLTIIEGGIAPTGSPYPWSSLAASSINQAAFTLTNPRGKWLAKYSNNLFLNGCPSGNPCNGGGNGNAVVGHDNFPAIAGHVMYLTYWAYPWQDPHNAASSNKFFRLTNDGGWDDEPNPCTIIWEPDSFYNYMFDTGQETLGWWVDWPGSQFQSGEGVGQWNRKEAIIDNTFSPKPNITININNQLFLTGYSGVNANPGNIPQQGGNVTGSMPADITGIYTIGADWSNAQSSPTPRYDWGEIYVDNTLARVEICDQNTKSGSSHCEIQIPTTTWNNSQLQITVNQGSFADNSSAYLYVIDASGNVSAGQQITFGSSSGGTSVNIPNPPTNLIAN